MSIRITTLIIISVLSGCTYEGIRMQERRNCAAMPQSQAERCYNRTRMTKGEYNSEREKLRRASEPTTTTKDEEPDPRYEKWIP